MTEEFKMMVRDIKTTLRRITAAAYYSLNHPSARLKGKVVLLMYHRVLTEKELDEVISRHIEKNRRLIDERGQGAFSSIMGSVMSEVRGATDPKLVTELVKKKLASVAGK